MEAEDYRHQRRFDVRFGDLDPVGHLNNVALVAYLEAARVEFFADLELASVDGLGFVIASLQVDFRGQAHFRDELVCGTRATRIGRTSIALEQALRATDDRPVAHATSTMVVLGDDGRTPTPVPDRWRQILEDWERRALSA